MLIAQNGYLFFFLCTNQAADKNSQKSYLCLLQKESNKHEKERKGGSEPLGKVTVNVNFLLKVWQRWLLHNIAPCLSWEVSNNDDNNSDNAFRPRCSL